MFLCFSLKRQDENSATDVFLGNLEIFKKSYFKEHKWAAASVLALLLYSDNLVRGCEKLTGYYKFDRNLSFVLFQKQKVDSCYVKN